MGIMSRKVVDPETGEQRLNLELFLTLGGMITVGITALILGFLFSTPPDRSETHPPDESNTVPSTFAPSSIKAIDAGPDAGRWDAMVRTAP